MRKLSLIIISTLLCLTVKSQSNRKPVQSFIKIDSKTHILKSNGVKNVKTHRSQWFD